MEGTANPDELQAALAQAIQERDQARLALEGIKTKSAEKQKALSSDNDALRAEAKDLRAENARLSEQLRLAENTAKEATTKANSMEEGFNALGASSYRDYLRAWPEAKQGKFTAPKGEQELPALAAVAMANADAAAGRMKAAKVFEAELRKLLFD